MWIKARLSFLTSSAACHKSLNNSTHTWPKEVCNKNILRLLDTKVSHQSVTTSVNYAPRFKPGCSEMVEIVRRGPNAHTGRPFGRPNHFQTTGLERAA